MSAQDESVPDTANAAREAAALNHLLGLIGLSASEQTGWWNHLSYEELGGRTPTHAWLAGDTDAVRSLVERWYAASKSAAERAADDPRFLALLRERLRELDARHPAQHLHRIP